MSANRKKKKGKTIYQRKAHDNIFVMVSLILIVGIVPLIVYLKVFTLSDVEKLYSGRKDPGTDLFSYYKMVFLLLFSSAGLLFFLFKQGYNLFDNYRRSYYIPLGIYSLFVIISALASEYPNISTWGFLERYEGVFVLMAYVLILFLSMNALKNEKFIKIFFLCLMASAFIISAIGALQFFGIELYTSEFGQNLIIPSAYRNENNEMTRVFGPKTVVSTLYNPNYVGSYTAMLVPVVLIFLIWFRKISQRLVLAALLCLLTISWIGCDSRAGIVGGLFSFVVIVIMFRKRFLKYKFIIITVLILLFSGLLAVNSATNGYVLNRAKEIVSRLTPEAYTESRRALDRRLQGLTDVTMDSERMKIVTDKGTLQISLLNNKLSITDENNKQIETTFNKNAIDFKDARFQSIKLGTKPEEGLIDVYYNGFHLINILLTKEGLKSNTNIWMTYRGNKSIETFWFAGEEDFASGRGYIWSRTIPLLKDTIFLGHGADTFPIYFPQYDFIGKLKMGNAGGIFVDKAHNIYLQTALNTGMISLLALLTLFGMYIISSIKIYIKEEFTTFLPIAGLACLSAFCGYAVAGMFNDSVVSVAPVFWVLLGLGIGINVMLNEKIMAASKVKGNVKAKRS